MENIKDLSDRKVPDMSDPLDTSDDHSTAGLVQWLRNQYARHKEIEDKLAADRIEQLGRELATYRNIVKGVHAALTDAGDIPVPGLEEPLDAVVRQLAEAKRDAMEDAARTIEALTMDRPAGDSRDPDDGLFFDFCAAGAKAIRAMQEKPK